VLVQTGDVLDRGEGSADALRLLAKLQRQARKVNGQVVVLMGNHELMNLMGYFKYETPEENVGFLPATRRDAFEKSHGEFGEFIRSFPAACVVEREHSIDASVLFVHGGLSAQFLEGKDAIEKLNSNLAQYLTLEMDDLFKKYQAPLLFDNGPFWNRFFAMSKNEGEVCSKLQQTLDLARAGKMVVGHTVQTRSTVNERCGGRLVLSDVGFSPYYYGHPLAVEHFHDGRYKSVDLYAVEA